MVDPLVEQAIATLGADTPQVAKKLGISKSLLYMILRGQRSPTDKLLAKLGLMRLKVITRKP